MVIEITLDSEKWLRADLVEWQQEKQNLYHIRFKPNDSIIQQYALAGNYVRQNFPKLRDVRIVTDLGMETTVI